MELNLFFNPGSSGPEFQLSPEAVLAGYILVDRIKIETPKLITRWVNMYDVGGDIVPGKRFYGCPNTAAAADTAKVDHPSESAVWVNTAPVSLHAA